MDQWLDWSAFGFLALLTLLDGLRRVPAGALVLRKILGGKWEVVEMPPGYRMVSWWPPLSTTVVLVPMSGRTAGPLKGLPRDLTVAQSQSDRRTVRLKEQFDGVRTQVVLLKALGAASLAALVIVVPVSMRWFGGIGFLLSLLVVLLLSWVVTALSFSFSRNLGLTTRQRIMFALPRLNPFATPAAGEALLERTFSGAEPLSVARRLMEEAEFARWIRPLAYDVVQGVDVERGAELVEVVGRKQLKVLVSSRPARVAADTPWCPRCGSEFGSASTLCPSCEIPLNV